jgi:hypothetical protein
MHVYWICEISQIVQIVLNSVLQYITRSLYFRIFLASVLITFLSPEIATSINRHVSFLLSRSMMSALLLGMRLSVFTCWLRNMVTLLSWLVSIDFGICSSQCSLHNFTPISLHMGKCRWAHSLSCRFIHCFSANIGHTDVMWCIFQSYCRHRLHSYLFLLSILIFHVFWFVTPALLLRFCFHMCPP